MGEAENRFRVGKKTKKCNYLQLVIVYHKDL